MRTHRVRTAARISFPFPRNPRFPPRDSASDLPGTHPMQQIERYGVIALVFLLVTIVAVSFWGDSKSPGFWSRLTGRGAKKEATSTQMADATTPPASAAERAIQSDLPMSPAETPAANSSSLVIPIETAPPANAAPTPMVPAQNSLA